MSRTSLPALCLLSLLLGCTPPEQHIQRVIDQTLATCRGAEGDFADIELFQGEKRPLLKQACEMPVEGLKVEDKVTATATVGPYLWKVSTHPESGIWVVSDIIWQDIDDARRILEMEKPDPNSLAHAEKKFAKLQESMPKNAWIHRERLTNALRLRKATRAIDHKEHGTPLTGLGPVAQAAYDTALTFADSQNLPQLAAQVRLAVIDYHRDYERFLDNTLEGSGEQDEWVQAAIDLAVKERKKDEEAKYRKELLERQETRKVREVEFKARKEEVHQMLCKELDGLRAEGVTHEEMVASINDLKTNTQCTPPADPTAATP